MIMHNIITLSLSVLNATLCLSSFNKLKEYVVSNNDVIANYPSCRGLVCNRIKESSLC